MNLIILFESLIKRCTRETRNSLREVNEKNEVDENFVREFTYKLKSKRVAELISHLHLNLKLGLNLNQTFRP